MDLIKSIKEFLIKLKLDLIERYNQQREIKKKYKEEYYQQQRLEVVRLARESAAMETDRKIQLMRTKFAREIHAASSPPPELFSPKFDRMQEYRPLVSRGNVRSKSEPLADFNGNINHALGIDRPPHHKNKFDLRLI